MASEYALLDAGDGGRLERFGAITVARPAPTADASRRRPAAWTDADAWYPPVPGVRPPPPTDSRPAAAPPWLLRAAIPDPWLVAIDDLTLELGLTDAGQVGLFPEHIPVWGWLRARIDERRGSGSATVLHLFAYTGGGTLAAAAAGATVVHVDASRPAVAWARRNARRSGLDERPIRWLVDDAVAFVERETRRGRRYDIIVLDPPSYGHGPSGRPWRIEAGLDPLLGRCLGLLAPDGCLLVTTHSSGLGPERLAAVVRDAAEASGRRSAIDRGPLDLVAISGAMLPLGAYAVVDGPRLS